MCAGRVSSGPSVEEEKGRAVKEKAIAAAPNARTPRLSNEHAYDGDSMWHAREKQPLLKENYGEY